MEVYALEKEVGNNIYAHNLEVFCVIHCLSFSERMNYNFSL